MARRKDLGAIVRGSALLLLGRYGAEAVEPAAALGLDDPEELVREAAVRSLQVLPPPQIAEYLGRMLADPVRAVRTEAARILSAVPRAELSPRWQAAFDAALEEYMAGQRSLAEQPGAHLCLGVIYANLRQPDKARAEYGIALELDPSFIPGRINLAMLDDAEGRKTEAEQEFRRVLQLDPKMAEAYYSLGLLVAEDEKRLPEAEGLLRKATELAPQNARMHYNYGLALQRQEKYDDAEAQLKRAWDLARPARPTRPPSSTPWRFSTCSSGGGIAPAAVPRTSSAANPTTARHANCWTPSANNCSRGSERPRRPDNLVASRNEAAPAGFPGGAARPSPSGQFFLDFLLNRKERWAHGLSCVGHTGRQKLGPAGTPVA